MESRKIQIPKDLSEVTLGQYQRIKAIGDDVPERDKIIRVLTALTDLTLNEIHRLSLPSLRTLLSEVNNTMQEAESYTLKQTFTHTPSKGRSVEVGFIPNLDSITLNEFVDLDNSFADPQLWHKFMGVCYRPIIKEQRTKIYRYEIEPYDFNPMWNDTMRNVTMDKVFGATLFFCRLGSELASCILKSGLHQVAPQSDKLTIPKSGVGIPHFISLVEDDLRTLPKSWASIHSIKRLLSLLTNTIE